MKFDTPAGTNPIDQLKVVGRPTDRIDGPYKTTGTATYAYEQHKAAPNAAVGYIVGASIAKTAQPVRLRISAARSGRIGARVANAQSERAIVLPSWQLHGVPQP